MKKRIVIAIAITLLVAIATFTIISYQRRSSYPFLEFTIIYVHMSGQPEITFIIERDRVFISYLEVTPDWRLPYTEVERAETALSREEFRRVSELLNAATDYYHYYHSSNDNWIPREQVSEWFILKHNGYEYVNENAIHESLFRLYWELRRLSPLRAPSDN